MVENRPTAGLVIIGNEILTGRTKDLNLNYIAPELVKTGVQLAEVRIVPDIEDEIVDALNALRNRYSYVFTTGGIGPTHDDITSASIAKAFGVKLIRHPEALKIMEEHYKGREQKLNEARLKMADVPEGAELIMNPVSGAPGYRLDNVFVLAGVPDIMRAMFDAAKHKLEGGTPVQSRTITALIPEGDVAPDLYKLQDEYPNIEIGSYPFYQNKPGVSIVLRGDDEGQLNELEDKIKKLLDIF